MLLKLLFKCVGNAYFGLICFVVMTTVINDSRYSWQVSYDEGHHWESVKITKDEIAMDAKKGDLTFVKFTHAHEAKYLCKATNKYKTLIGGYQDASSFSAITTLKILSELLCLLVGYKHF